MIENDTQMSTLPKRGRTQWPYIGLRATMQSASRSATAAARLVGAIAFLTATIAAPGQETMPELQSNFHKFYQSNQLLFES